ncbi:MAG: tripartite tricarboxylate transporter TctB family protein [Alphaproteobacteria bacterium]|nr:tripartite tricarboxylate transporter TctB family protein [Alphaproteobacteria bacterium]
MDRWIGGGLVAAALAFVFLVVPTQITVPQIAIGGGMGGVVASPHFFPTLIAAFLALLGVSIFLRGHGRARTLADGEGFELIPAQLLRVGATAAILIAYWLLLEQVGYVILTPVAILLLATFLGYRRWLLLIAVAAAFTVIVYAGFRYGMQIFLPEGLLD